MSALAFTVGFLVGLAVPVLLILWYRWYHGPHGPKLDI